MAEVADPQLDSFPYGDREPSDAAAGAIEHCGLGVYPDDFDTRLGERSRDACRADAELEHRPAVSRSQLGVETDVVSAATVCLVVVASVGVVRRCGVDPHSSWPPFRHGRGKGGLRAPRSLDRSRRR